jgi:hypothetical protein
MRHHLKDQEQDEILSMRLAFKSEGFGSGIYSGCDKKYTWSSGIKTGLGEEHGRTVCTAKQCGPWKMKNKGGGDPSRPTAIIGTRTLQLIPDTTN